jgi:hypothetical protein
MMKSVLHIVSILFLVGIVCLPSRAQAVTCNTIIPDIYGPPIKRVAKIQEALDNYKNYPAGAHQAYSLCFDMSTFHVTAGMLSQPFQLETDGDETWDVNILGLKLQSDAVDPVPTELLHVNNRGSGRVVMQDIEFKNVTAGIRVSGPGQTHILLSKILGDDLLSDACISIESEGAFVEGVEVKGCDVGIDVKAPEAKIKDSKVWANGIGIQIAESILGTDIEKTQIWGNSDDNIHTPPNTDGIRIVGGAVHGLEFNQTGPDIIMSVVLPDGYELGGRIELYYAAGEPCGLTGFSNYQAPCYLDWGEVPNPIELTTDTLSQRPIEFHFQPQHYSMQLVAIYTHPVLGTSEISKAFNISYGGVVAFVTHPYDIPTTGSEMDENVDDDNAMTDEGGSVEGQSSLTDRSSVGGGCAASLVAISHEHVSFGLNTFLFLFVFGVAFRSRGVRN